MQEYLVKIKGTTISQVVAAIDADHAKNLCIGVLQSKAPTTEPLKLSNLTTKKLTN